jgi:hypothetical protein
MYTAFEAIVEALDISKRLDRHGWRLDYESEISRTWSKGRWVCKIAKTGEVYFFRF